MQLSRILFFPLVAALAACSPDPPPPVAEAPPPRNNTPHYVWNDDGGAGEIKIRINLNAQRAYISRGDRPVGWTYVATGREGYNTPAGNYRITEKIVDKHSNRYGWIENAAGETVDHDASPGDPVPPGCRYVAAPMPYWMRITGYGIGMHAGNIPRPGSPASHGCIRLPKPFAPVLYDAVKVGTPVTVEYGKAIPWEVHPDPLPRRAPAPAPASAAAAGDDFDPSNRDGLRVVSPDDPWIVWPEGHPRAKFNRRNPDG